MLANCTHRREDMWEFQCFITTATFTGCRMAVVALPDPSFDSYHISPELIWGAVMNRRGTMVEASGQTGRRTAFRIRTSTAVLSNASPPQAANMMGYSAAILLLYCLQPPIAVNEQTELAMTVMGRCLVRCINPVPGYSLFQTPIHHDNSPVAPGATPAWVLEVSATAANAEMDGDDYWIGSHNGGAWLAGGMYFEFWKWGQNAPGSDNLTGSGQGKGVAIYGKPLRMSVYATQVVFPYWEDNDRSHKVPRYFVTFVNPIHHSVNMVGFQLQEHAMMQARGDTGMVPHGAELCLRYRGHPKWLEVFPEGQGTRIVVKFFLIWTSDKAYPFGGPIYNSVNTCSSISTATASYTNTAPVAMTATTWSTNPFRAAPIASYQQPAGLQQHQPLPLPQEHQPFLLTPHQLATQPIYSPTSQTHLQQMPQSSLAPTSSSLTNATSYSTSGTSLGREALLETVSAMQHQINTLLSQMSALTIEKDQGCQCLGACSCPALRHSSECVLPPDPSMPDLEGSGDESDDTLAASDTEWDTASDNTQAMQDHLAWIQQQQQQLEVAARRHQHSLLPLTMSQTRQA